jgi:hypothetical protein
MGRGNQTINALNPVTVNKRNNEEKILSSSSDRTYNYSELEIAGDEDFKFFLREDLKVEPSECRFTLGKVEIETMKDEMAVTSPEDYLFDGDEEGYEHLLNMIETYEEHGVKALPPIAYWTGSDNKNHILDGRRRLYAAHHSNITHLPAYKLIRS